MRDSLDHLYLRGVHNDPNLVSDRRLLTSSLASSIHEKRNLAAKLRAERMKIQREMKVETQSFRDVYLKFKILKRE
jgi:hypothetical protein